MTDRTRHHVSAADSPEPPPDRTMLLRAAGVPPPAVRVCPCDFSLPSTPMPIPRMDASLLPARLSALLSRLNARQRLAAGAAAAAAAIGLAALVFLQSSAGRLPLLEDKTWNSDQVAAASSLLHSVGIQDVVVVNGRPTVRPADHPRASSVAAGLFPDAPSRWTDEWERANEKLGQFSGKNERDAAREMARARQISVYLSRLPDVEFADVVWDEDSARSWRQPQQGRATVYLKPRPGREITLDLVHAVRVAVSRSKGDLSPANVAVMDLGRMITYDGEDLGAGTAAAFTRAASLRAFYRQQIERRLSFIPGLRVVVHVDPLPFAAARANPALGAESDLPVTGANVRMALGQHVPFGAAASSTSVPPRVTASIAVPTAYHHRVAHARPPLSQTPQPTSAEMESALAAAERDVAAVIRERIAQILPVADPASLQSLVQVETIRAATAPITAPAATAASIASRLRILPPRGPLGILVALAVVGIAGLAFRHRPRLRRHPSDATAEVNRSIGPSHLSGAESTGIHVSPVSVAQDAAIESAYLPLATEFDEQNDTPSGESPLAFLNHSGFSEWLPVLLCEKPAALAVIVSQLRVDQTGLLLGNLSLPVQADVIRRMAQLAPPSHAELLEITQQLQANQASAHERRATGTSIEPASGDILPWPIPAEETIAAEPPSSPSRLADFEPDDPQFDFDQIRELAPHDVQNAAIGVPPREWAIALRGASNETVRHVLHSLARPVSEEVRQELAGLGPTRIAEIESAQQRIGSLLSSRAA